MKLSSETIEILKNFAGINPSIIFKKGNVLSTMSIQKNIVASATIKETFDRTFGIYQLTQLLSVINLFDDPELSFSDENLTISSNSSNCQYNYCEQECIIHPKKLIVLPSNDVSFEISKDDLDKIIKAAANLSLNDIMIYNEDGKLFVSVIDSKRKDSNKFSIQVGTSDHDSDFKLYILSEQLKIIKGSYKVNISSKGISEWIGKECSYIITLEKSSKF